MFYDANEGREMTREEIDMFVGQLVDSNQHAIPSLMEDLEAATLGPMEDSMEEFNDMLTRYGIPATVLVSYASFVCFDAHILAMANIALLIEVHTLRELQKAGL